MSYHLIDRWRRLSTRWRGAAEDLPLDEFAKRVDAFARADTYRQCAASLERSIEIARRKARKPSK